MTPDLEAIRGDTENLRAYSDARALAISDSMTGRLARTLQNLDALLAEVERLRDLVGALNPCPTCRTYNLVRMCPLCFKHPAKWGQMAGFPTIECPSIHEGQVLVRRVEANGYVGTTADPIPPYNHTRGDSALTPCPTCARMLGQ